jgi:Trm5-related predicted tRNA methylase
VFRHLSQLNVAGHLVGVHTSKSYLNLYQHERLIYLSPHAEEKLTTEDVMEESNVFVIGGIVDRVKEPNIHPQASLVCAQEEGIRCKKLPLDDYIE